MIGEPTRGGIAAAIPARPRQERGRGGRRGVYRGGPRRADRGFDEFGLPFAPMRPRLADFRRTPDRPSESEIRRRAYEIHLRNGREGNAVLDWLEAEQELLAAMRRRTRPRTAIAGAPLRSADACT